MKTKNTTKKPTATSTITINIGKRSIRLTEDEARQLWRELGSLVNPFEKTIPTPAPFFPPMEVPPEIPKWMRPPHRDSWYDPRKIICATGTSCS